MLPNIVRPDLWWREGGEEAQGQGHTAHADGVSAEHGGEVAAQATGMVEVEVEAEVENEDEHGRTRAAWQQPQQPQHTAAVPGAVAAPEATWAAADAQERAQPAVRLVAACG